MSSEILMPRLSDSMEEGEISRWVVEDGAEIQAGDVIVEIETDKATMEVESEAGGFIRLLVGDGATVSVGEPIALVGSKEALEARAAEAAAPATDDPTPALPTAAPQPPAPAAVEPRPASSEDSAGERILSTPLARRIAREANVDLADIGAGIGPRGRIHKADVESFIAAAAATPAAESPAAAPEPRADGELEEPTRIQRLIAERMSAAKREVPHYYLAASAEIEAAMELRATIAESGEKFSLTDLVVLACARALRAHPEVNSSWVEGKLRRNPAVNVGVAVATADGGLVVPVLREADRMSILELARASIELIARARDGDLSLAELEGGTFSVSNLGMFGVEEFHAIVNPPESGILAVGGIDERLALVSGVPRVRRRLRFSLSADHRVYSGAKGAEFLAAVRWGLENPSLLLAGAREEAGR